MTSAAEETPPVPTPLQSRNHLLAVIPASEFRELKAHSKHDESRTGKGGAFTTSSLK